RQRSCRPCRRPRCRSGHAWAFFSSPQPCACERARWFCSVLIRAMVRRTSRTRDGFSSWLVADWNRRLNCSRFSWSSCCCSWSSVITLISSIAAILLCLRERFTETGHDLRLDRQLLGSALERGLRDRARNAVQLEQDSARFDPSHPIFGRSLARAHSDFGRLGAHRNVREN